MVELRPEVGVPGEHRGVGATGQRSCRGAVHRQLEAPAADRRILRRDLAELVGLARLVVGDGERAVGQLVDAVDLALEADGPTVGEDQLDPPVLAELLLGRQQRPPGPPGAVVPQPRVEGAEHLRPRVDPERRAPGPAGSVQRIGHLLAGTLQDGGMLVGPAARSGRRHGPVEHRPVQAVDGVVDGRAAVERAQRLDVGGLVDGPHAEHVVHEVGVGAGGPRLDARRRDGGRQRRDAPAGQVAVELGEPIARPGVAEPQRPAEDGVVAASATGRGCRRRPGCTTTARAGGARPVRRGTRRRRGRERGSRSSPAGRHRRRRATGRSSATRGASTWRGGRPAGR